MHLHLFTSHTHIAFTFGLVSKHFAIGLRSPASARVYGLGKQLQFQWSAGEEKNPGHLLETLVCRLTLCSPTQWSAGEDNPDHLLETLVD